MKYIITILFLLVSSVIIAQCEAITINTLHLERYPDCKYVIKLNTTLTHGNPSIRAVYSCGNVDHDLPCWNWPNPTTITFGSDTFTCDCNMIVRVKVIGHASPNCNGNSCLELGLTNLELKPARVSIKSKASSWFISGNRLITDFDKQSISIYNVAGSLLYSNTSNDSVTYLPKLTSGAYILVIQTSTRRIVKRIIL